MSKSSMKVIHESHPWKSSMKVIHESQSIPNHYCNIKHNATLLSCHFCKIATVSHFRLVLTLFVFPNKVYFCTYPQCQYIFPQLKFGFWSPTYLPCTICHFRFAPFLGKNVFSSPTDYSVCPHPLCQFYVGFKSDRMGCQVLQFMLVYLHLSTLMGRNMELDKNV